MHMHSTDTRVYSAKCIKSWQKSAKLTGQCAMCIGVVCALHMYLCECCKWHTHTYECIRLHFTEQKMKSLTIFIRMHQCTWLLARLLFTNIYSGICALSVNGILSRTRAAQNNIHKKCNEKWSCIKNKAKWKCSYVRSWTLIHILLTKSWIDVAQMQMHT